MNKVFHCLFEQSGTFKKEFIKLGYQAFDYDILNDFGETDYQIDLFNEIEKSFTGGASIFDDFKKQDTIIAFFPCTRFENQILLHFRGESMQQKKHTDIQKLKKDLQLHKELHELYTLITKLAIICLRKEIPLIIENPYSTQHYLTNYWCLKPSIIDKDRTENGDYFKKPTQYWFIGCEAQHNFIFEPLEIVEIKTIINTHDKVERSLIHPQYANRFIREHILKEK